MPRKGDHPVPYFCQRCGFSVINAAAGMRTCSNTRCRWVWESRVGWHPDGPGPYAEHEFQPVSNETNIVENIVRAFLRGVALRGTSLAIPESPELRAAAREIDTVCGMLTTYLSGPSILWIVEGGLEKRGKA